jgi:hypothetical protein
MIWCVVVGPVEGHNRILDLGVPAWWMGFKQRSLQMWSHMCADQDWRNSLGWTLCGLIGGWVPCPWTWVSCFPADWVPMWIGDLAKFSKTLWAVFFLA